MPLLTYLRRSHTRGGRPRATPGTFVSATQADPRSRHARLAARPEETVRSATDTIQSRPLRLSPPTTGQGRVALDVETRSGWFIEVPVAASRRRVTRRRSRPRSDARRRDRRAHPAGTPGRPAASPSPWHPHHVVVRGPRRTGLDRRTDHGHDAWTRPQRTIPSASTRRSMHPTGVWAGGVFWNAVTGCVHGPHLDVSVVPRRSSSGRS